MEEKAPKVEVQGVPGAFGSTEQQPQDTPTPSQEGQNGLDEFLTFDAKPNGLKQETEEMETEEAKEEVVETTEDENVDVVFEVNGQKINACMSASMAQMLKDSEEMRLQVIDKIMSEAGSNPDQPITVTTAEPLSRDTSATESADSPTIKKQPRVITTPAPTVTSRLNGQVNLGKRPLVATVAADNKYSPIRHKVVTRGSVGIMKPKYEPKFVPSATLRPATIQKAASPYVAKAFAWDHKAIVALIEVYKGVNERVTAMGASRNIDLWGIVGKRMRVRGFQVSDADCKNKFNALTICNASSFRTPKKDSPGGKNPTWEPTKLGSAFVDDSLAGKAKLTNKTKPNPRGIPVITVEDDSPAESDAEGLEENDTADPSAKRAKTEAQASAIDKFRRTYLRVETEKLKEMKAARALQQEQCKLQKERNEILNSIATLLGLKK